MLDGETAGINKWETASSPFGRVGYSPLLTWAEEQKYIEIVSGKKLLSEKGREFCKNWLARREGTPLLTRQAPETAENPMNHAMPCPETPGGAGEGGIIDQIEYDGPVPALPPNSQRVVRAIVRKDKG
jgi:hypothetical protein